MKANRSLREFKDDRKAFAAQMGGMIALLVAIIVGVLVFYQLNSSLEFTNNRPSNTVDIAQRATWNNTNATASTVFTLLPIVAIVMIAGIILAVVTRFGTGAGGGI